MFPSLSAPLTENRCCSPIHQETDYHYCSFSISSRYVTIAPPRYDLEPDVVIALKGGSARMNFTVTSDHKMPRIIKHTIKREDGTTVIKFEVSEEFVTFSEVKTNDSGIYTISCHNDYGTVGKESFELLVVPGIYLQNISCK